MVGEPFTFPLGSKNWKVFSDSHYDSFRNRLLNKCTTEANRCPFCEEPYDEIAEFVDVGVGQVQVTPNVCQNRECGASETGQYELTEELYDFKDGWHRPKPNWKELEAALQKKEPIKGKFADDETPQKKKAPVSLQETEYFRKLAEADFDDVHPKKPKKAPKVEDDDDEDGLEFFKKLMLADMDEDDDPKDT